MPVIEHLMTKLDSLLILVNSMDTAEKRYFQINTKMHEGKKDYKILFDLILQSGLSIDLIKTKFKKHKPEGSFEVACNHLYNLLIDKLSARDSEKEVEFQVLKAYQQARFLFRRNVFDDAFQLIEKYKQIALEYELFSQFLLLAKLEVRFHNQLEFKEIDETKLVKLQSKIESVSRQQRAIENHTGLYNLISIRQSKQGIVRNETEKEKLNDLAFNELQAVSGQIKNSFEAQKLHLLFQSAYFMKTANPKSSLKVYYELNELFENNRKLWGNPPYFYLNHVKGILNNLRWFGKYEEMPFFIDKMKGLLTQYSSGKIFIQNLIYLFESLILTDQRKYAEALQHLESQVAELTEKIASQPFVSRSELALQQSTVYFWNHDYKRATKIIRPILTAGKPFLQVPQVKTMRYINMLIHLEQNDFDYLDSEIRSFERSLKKKEKLVRSEEILLNVVRLCCRQTNLTKKMRYIKEQIHSLLELKHDPYENQFLRTFDFIQWMETKIKQPST
jgi:hypothetical protein